MFKFTIFTAKGGAIGLHNYVELEKGKVYSQQNSRFIDDDNIESVIDRDADRSLTLNIKARRE